MQVDSSPYFAVHQVVPGGNMQDAVQGELVSEQLEDRITQVWSTRVRQIAEFNNKSRELTFEIVSPSTGMDFSQSTSAFTSEFDATLDSRSPSATSRQH